MDSGIGSGFGLGSTERVGDAAAGQNQSSPRARDREDRRRRRKDPEKISVNDPATKPSAGEKPQGPSEGVEEATERKEDEGEGEDERPPHRVDSLA
jgi:hypothetical protein